MDSKSTLFAIIFLLGIALLVQGFENGTSHDADHKQNRRYKRMYVMCPPKFSRIGNECYYISPGKQNWLDAYFECKDHNSKLAEPMKYEDKHLRRYLQKINLSEDLWIGGTYNWKVNKWQWGHNGRDIEYQSFSQMVPGSSKDLKYHCALLRSDLKFRWSAKECTTKINFICQHRMPLVSENGRYSLYDKWNKTYPDQQANEKMVYIMDEPNNRNLSNNHAKPRIYNSVKRVMQSNPSIKPRPEHRRKPSLRKRPVKPATGAYYIPPDVVVGRKQHLAQYAPDAPNDINTVDNGHRNGYHSISHFNVDFSTRNGKNRVASLPGGYRPGYGSAAHMETRGPHQHRHQPGMHKTTKRTHYFLPTRPPTTPSNTKPTTTTTTTSTTTTTTPRPQTTTSWPTPTKRVPYYSPVLNNVLKQHTTHPMSTDERKLKREKLRERLQRLSYEEQLLFFQDRAKRKKLKEQQHRDQHRDNEVVQ